MYLNVRDNINDNPYYSFYVIKQGDTLYKISENYKVNPKLVAELNGLDIDEYIYPNQTILIPKKGVQFYITKNDDTLKEVSKIFDVEEYALVNQNKRIYLLPGQMIFYKE